MSDDAAILLAAACVVALGTAWTLLLLGCVRRRGEPIVGRRRLTAAGLCGALGPASAIGLFFLAGVGGRAADELQEALALTLIGSQCAALLAALSGLRGVWRQTEGWADE